MPYVLVLIGGIAGINVFVVLLIGIISGAAIMLGTGGQRRQIFWQIWDPAQRECLKTSWLRSLWLRCALIREYGGFEALLSAIRRVFKGKRAVSLGMGLLVGAMDISNGEIQWRS